MRLNTNLCTANRTVPVVHHTHTHADSTQIVGLLFFFVVVPLTANSKMICRLHFTISEFNCLLQFLIVLFLFFFFFSLAFSMSIEFVVRSFRVLSSTKFAFHCSARSTSLLTFVSNLSDFAFSTFRLQSNDHERTFARIRLLRST